MILKEMLKLEFRKALRNKSFYISLIIGCIITMFSLVYNIEIYQNEIMMIQGDRLNPMYGVLSLFNRWIGGEPFSFGSSAYFFVFPLLVAIPYGWSYCGEKQSGYTRLVTVYSGKKAYFLAKYAAVFLSGALAMVLPLVFNFLVSALFFPAVTPSPLYCTSNGVFYGSLMSMLYYSAPFLYVFFYLCIDFVFGGLIACLSYSVSCIVKYKVIVVILPLFLLLAFHYLRQFIYTSPEVHHYKEISPLFFLRPVQIVYHTSWTVILIGAAILFFITFLSIIWEYRHEIY